MAAKGLPGHIRRQPPSLAVGVVNKPWGQVVFCASTERISHEMSTTVDLAVNGVLLSSFFVKTQTRKAQSYRFLINYSPEIKL